MTLTSYFKENFKVVTQCKEDSLRIHACKGVGKVVHISVYVVTSHTLIYIVHLFAIRNWKTRPRVPRYLSYKTKVNQKVSKHFSNSDCNGTFFLCSIDRKENAPNNYPM